MTLEELHEGSTLLRRHGVPLSASVVPDRDIIRVYAEDDDPNPELLEAMNKAGWKWDEDWECFALVSS